MGERIEAFSKDKPIDVPRIRKAFVEGPKGSQKRAARRILKGFYQDRAWKEQCAIANEFADDLAAHCHDRSTPFTTFSAVTKNGGYDNMLPSFVEKWKHNKIDLRIELLRFFMTAPKTVLSILVVACSLLSRHPDVWKRLRDEVLAHDINSLD